jgi:single-strand DNA-binding protein
MIEFFITGNLGSDAVMNSMNGRGVINFLVCHSDAWRNRDGNKETKKTWVDCAFVSDSQELLQKLTKGTLVYAKGTPSVKIHTPDNGDPVAVQYLKVSKVEILHKK